MHFGPFQTSIGQYYQPLPTIPILIFALSAHISDPNIICAAGHGDFQKIAMFGIVMHLKQKAKNEAR